MAAISDLNSNYKVKKDRLLTYYNDFFFTAAIYELIPQTASPMRTS